MERNEAQMFVGLAEAVLQLAEFQTASLKMLTIRIEAMNQMRRLGDQLAKGGSAELRAEFDRLDHALTLPGQFAELSATLARLESKQEQLGALLANVKASLRKPES
jgi:hypothetical protein